MNSNQEQPLGSGGYGLVYLKPCGRVVKYPLKPNVKTIELFKCECKILENLDHPNIIAYLGIQEKDEQGNDKFGILMEYCERGDLTKIIFNPKWVYTMKWVITGAEQLFEALAYLWDRKLTHRDIKPSNIFIKENFLLKLGDFGTVREIEKTASGTFDIGTVRYLSPPQFGNDHENPEDDQRIISHKNDVYSLGLTMWEMFERRLVFEEYIHSDWQGKKSFKRDKFTTDIQQKRLTHVQWPSACEAELVMKCTQFNREMRPNARQVLEMFRESREAPFSYLIIWNHPDQLPMESDEPHLIKPFFFDYNKDSETWELASKTFLFHENEELERQAYQLKLENDVSSYAEGNLMAYELHHLQPIAKLMKRYNYCTPSFLPWHNYAQIKGLIEKLEIEQARMLPNRKLSFKLFFPLSTKTEEFLLFEDDPICPILLKSDFTQRPRKGKWVPGTEKKICLLGDEEFELSEMTKTMDIAEILILLEKVKNGIVMQTKHRLSKFVPLDESENRTRKISHQAIGDKLKKDYVLFQLRNPPRHGCIHEPTCNLENFGTFWSQWGARIPTLITEIPKELAISVYSKHRFDCECDYDTCSQCCCPYEDPLHRLMQWADGCRWLQTLHEDSMGYHVPPIRLYSFPVDCLIFLQVVNKREENGTNYLTLLDHPINYATYEKICCMDESFNFEEIHVSKIQQWIQETRPEERRYLLYKTSDYSGNLFHILDHQGNELPYIHEQSVENLDRLWSNLGSTKECASQLSITDWDRLFSQLP